MSDAAAGFAARMNEPFSEKLTLVLKVLSMSRARLAAELGIDKSVVARWASGATQPSGHNLAQLSTLMAKVIPGFTALDWDGSLENLAERLGVRQPKPPPAAGKPSLALPFLDQIAATTGLRRGAYEGVYRSTRAYAGLPGRFIHDHILVRTDQDGLMRFSMNTGGVKVEGWVLPMQSQLFIVGSEYSGGSLVFAILHGVNSIKADVLDGVLLTSTMDIGRTPTASAVVYQRVGDLTGDRDADDARLVALAAGNPVAPEGSLPETLLRHLLRDITGDPAATIAGLLRLPLTPTMSRGPAPELP